MFTVLTLLLLTLPPATLATNPPALPGSRLPRLRELLNTTPWPLKILETHSGLSGLIAEQTQGSNGQSFDGMWSSSLTASSLQGLPDIEAVDTTARLELVRQTLGVTSKPMIYDGDTGGHPEVFRFTVRALERLGVSACIIEDKTGLKQNSLFGTDRVQLLEDVDAMCDKFRAGLEARVSDDFMIFARIEALIAGAGMEEALMRARRYTEVGCSGIMIHSKEKDGAEIFEFIEKYKQECAQRGGEALPIVVVPSSYDTVTEDELREAGVAIVIYANQILRASIPAMERVAVSILENGRSHECRGELTSVKDILVRIDDGTQKVDAKVEVGKRDDAKKKGGAPKVPRGGAVVPGVGPRTFLDKLRSLGVNFFTGVPDSCIATFCAELDEPSPGLRHVVASNEGAAVGTAMGHHLATGGVPCVYLQNSGVGNAINPLVSAAHKEVYGCPMLLIIGWRGAPGVDDEPQHIVQGRKTEAMLDSADVKHFTLPKDEKEALKVVAEAVAAAIKGSCPVAVLAPPKTFKGSKKAPSPQPAGATKPTREQAVAAIVKAAKPSDAIVSTTGYTSRELYELRGARGESHASDFLTVGSMGHALAIAQGIALEQPKRVVWCLDGDGAALMHLGSLALSKNLPNLRHVLLDNGVHDSVGGQATVATQWDGAGVDFARIADATGYKRVAVAKTLTALDGALKQLDGGGEGAAFVHVLLSPGTRGDLGRPTTTTGDAKKAFMGHLKEPSQRKLLPAMARSETNDPLLLTPGPLTTSRSVKEAMLHDYGSRDASFIEATARMRRQIVEVLGESARPLTCVPLQGSGTYAIEAMITQFVEKKAGKLLILANGAYGRRMAEIASRHGLSHELVTHSEDKPIDAEAVRTLLASEKGLTHVAVVHCETTTGVLNPLSAIADVVAEAGLSLLVDAMSSFGILPIEASMPFDAIAASSNKGLEGAPGLGFVISPKALLESSKGNADTAVLDLHAQWVGFEKNGQWRFTPPTHVVLALGRALDELAEEGGVEGRRRRYSANCKELVSGMRGMGFVTLLDDAAQAPTIVTFRMPGGGFNFPEFYDALARRGYLIYPGKLTEVDSFRVGCMGKLDEAAMKGFNVAVGAVLKDMGVKTGAPL